MLATVGKILADSNLNIARLSLGRREEGMEALTVINLDSSVDSKIINQLSTINGVHNVYSVIL